MTCGHDPYDRAAQRGGFAQQIRVNESLSAWRLRVDPGPKGCGLCAREANPATYLIKDPPRPDHGVDRLAQAVDL